jgi:mannose-1-phosphate guanylyltransferase
VKAFLLAAGLGTRLRPVTSTVPKCMVEIGGSVLLDIWLDALAAADVDEVLVNLHYLPDVVAGHLARRAGRPEVATVLEPDLLGSAGTLAANRAWVAGEEMFLACYADNLTDFDLAALIAAHRGSGELATLTAFRSANPSAGGVLKVDSTGLLTGFAEKPACPSSDLVNAGMYAFAPAVFDEIPAIVPADIGYHLLPKLTGRARVIPVGGYFRDIGTLETYGLARKEWPARAAR